MHQTTRPVPPNTLYYGDNLDVLRQHIADESVDLIYLDPPFNSKADYNAFFTEQDGSRAAAQLKAFGDTWKWDQGSARAFDEFVTDPAVPHRPKSVLLAFQQMLGPSDMLAYLAMMAPRLAELRRVLKPTGSLYLHCDTTASHYLKPLLDAVFGAAGFRNEIIWKRTFAHGNVGKRYGRIADSIFFYTASNRYTWNQLFTPPEDEAAKYPLVERAGDRERRWQSVSLRNPSPRPNLHYLYTASNGVTYEPHPNGWSCKLSRMRRYDAEGRLHFPDKEEGRLRLKMYADESEGEKLQNIWTDIPPLAANAAERLGYPTQKPVALLERIITASSRKGDVVLDPFCGCGTTIAAAHKHDRRWIGIDITSLATTLIKNRLRGEYGPKVGATYRVVGEPTTVEDAAVLAASDQYQFQWWALGLVGARPLDQKKGADRGVDGRLYFTSGTTTHQAIFSVKAGTNVSVRDVRDLIGTVDNQRAAIGVLLTMHPPTRPMRTEAASAEFFKPVYKQSYPRIQILTVGELLAGKKVDMPAWAMHATYKQARRVRTKPVGTPSLPLPDED